MRVYQTAAKFGSEAVLGSWSKCHCLTDGGA